MKKCPYNNGWDCPYYKFAFGTCGRPDSKCYERGEKISNKKKKGLDK